MTDLLFAGTRGVMHCCQFVPTSDEPPPGKWPVGCAWSGSRAACSLYATMRWPGRPASLEARLAGPKRTRHAIVFDARNTRFVPVSRARRNASDARSDQYSECPMSSRMWCPVTWPGCVSIDSLVVYETS